VPSVVADACNTGKVRITLLSRADCAACARARADLRPVIEEFAVEFEDVDVDLAAASDPSLRAEYGDRLPVILLDDREHSYWDVDIPRLRADLRAAAGH
jgi:glutaredoxin